MDKAQALRDLYADLEKTAPSLPLATKASDIVPGEGNPDADIFFIGEAPGYHESVQRRPFVGVSGKFLRKTMTEVGLNEEDVYIGNIVKVRPPDNRDPSPAEILAYKQYLDQEIEIIEPLLIVTLGRFSMAKFLPDVKISQVHGRLHKVVWNQKALFVFPMYHPAAALRGTKMRESFATDMKKVPKVLKWVQQQQETIALESDVKDILL
ncbi:MAG TPA: uracil-DNA glycosylase [Patescibacteria group bacterium]